MNYLIISYDDYFNIPYIRYYEDYIRKMGGTYDIVLWNRSGKDTHISNSYVFSGKDYPSKVRKVVPFLRWRRFVIQLLKQKHYDRLIVLTTMPGILLADQLLGHYKKKYWLDIRDFTYENIFFYKRLVGRLVRAASAVSISSPAFRSFLPQSDNIFLTHNISNQDALVQHCDLDTAQRPLNIGFVGGIQFVAQNQMLLRKFSNSDKYHLKYIGKPHLGCDMQPFCEKNGIKNAEFIPAFTNDQKPQIYRSLHLINSVYGCDNQVVRLLLPNRLYDCILFKKPMLVSKGTYLAEVVEKYHLGVAVDAEKDNVVKILDDYLARFDHNQFDNGCCLFLQKVESEISEYMNALHQFCSSSHSINTH